MHKAFDFVTIFENTVKDYEWKNWSASLSNAQGEVIFEQKDVEFPVTWSQSAVNIVCEKYFRTIDGRRESSLKQLLKRVVGTIYEQVQIQGYFSRGDEELKLRFVVNLLRMMIEQRAAFNSPVWFNVGVQENPQISACFISNIEDSMEGIMEFARDEAMIFKSGSGSGANFSTLRSSKEGLSKGGTASGPTSFMRGLDAFAGAVKSGGAVRRAAKICILNADHPDIEEFIQCKVEEEKKARSLIGSGWSERFDSLDGAYASVQYQNANNSVRVTDDFMKAAAKKADYQTKKVVTGEVCETLNAGEVLRKISKAVWECGDPGILFDTVINESNTCPGFGRINATNPCGEVHFLDNSACNLASLNLPKYLQGPDENGEFNFDSKQFCFDARTLVTAMDAMIDFATYPNELIRDNVLKFRPIGIGYTNLGALLMRLGLPYDSILGRKIGRLITELMLVASYTESGLIAKELDFFDGANLEANKGRMKEIVQVQHKRAQADRRNLHALKEVNKPLRSVFSSLIRDADALWPYVTDPTTRFRNAHLTVLAPTGTISFMMDCQTTGIEPEFALVKYKKMVGGGYIKTCNEGVEAALLALGYPADKVAGIVEYVADKGMVVDAPHLLEQHYPIFDTAMSIGGRSISPEAHINMVAEVQTFISGGISKTVNVDKATTPKEIERLLFSAWEKGLKGISIYRDGCKGDQPLTTKEEKKEVQAPKEEGKKASLPPVKRCKLPDERRAICHKFMVGGHEGYIHVGLYANGKPGEVFIRMAKEGSTISGLMDSLATTLSISLQYGVPLEVFTTKYVHTRFEPSGFTSHKDIKIAKSIVDYIGRWLNLKFNNLYHPDEGARELSEMKGDKMPVCLTCEEEKTMMDSPLCPNCGSMTVRSGTCHRCTNCGESLGCS